MTETDKHLEQIIIAVKNSYLPNTSKKVLMLLLTVKCPIKLAIISNETGYSKPHAWSIVKRLISQKLVKKHKSIGVSEYTYTKECDKLLSFKESLIFYQTKINYNIQMRNNKSI